MDEIEIVDVCYSDIFAKLKRGGWKKQLNELSDGTYEVEVYWVHWITEEPHGNYYQRSFVSEENALVVYNDIDTISKAKKLLYKSTNPA